MAKPTSKQKEIIKRIIIEVGYWATTNDISSPTHGSDLTHELEKFEEDFGMSKKDYLEIDTHLWQIFNIIRRYE